MLYLGIDQHVRQITISLRNEEGDVLQARQVSTEPQNINAFFQQLTRERLASGESFVAVLEVCGFNDWLIRMLQDYRCHKVVLIQPEERNQRKTDRRDAAALSELLWVNRSRLLAGKSVRGLRQVDVANTTDQQNRRLTTLRKEAGRCRARLINKVKHLLRRHNLQWQMPTKTFPTQRAILWLQELALPAIDQLELNHLLVDLEHTQQRLDELDGVIARQCETSEEAMILMSTPGIGPFTATALACRVGRVGRFPRAHSLANYWGLTPGCRNSGEYKQRLGSITKAGSSMARWLLAQDQAAVAPLPFPTATLLAAGVKQTTAARQLRRGSGRGGYTPALSPVAVSVVGRARTAGSKPPFVTSVGKTVPERVCQGAHRRFVTVVVWRCANQRTCPGALSPPTSPSLNETKTAEQLSADPLN